MIGLHEPLPWWTGSAARTTEKHLSRARRLGRLDITNAGYRLYDDLFLTYRRHDVYSERARDGTWPTFRRRWNDSLILRHLCGEIDLAIPFGDTVDQIVIDIDYKGDRKWRDVERTAAVVTSAFPGDPLAYQSSDSSGIRLIWFLSEAASRPDLYQWAVSELGKAGVPVRPGICEVRLGRSPDRLPFGSGSLLIDPLTLEPFYNLSLSKTLNLVSDHRRWHSVDVRPLKAEYDDSSPRYKSLIRECLDHGLPSDVDTNDCLLALAWHGRMRLRLNNRELCDFLQHWITTKHNGNSRRVNSGREQNLFSQIERIVNNLRAESRSSSQSPLCVGLCEVEVLALLDYPGDFKTIEGAFQVLCYAKAGLIHDGSRRKQSIGRGGTNKWGTVFCENEDIPNGARNFVPAVDLPKTLLRRLKVPWRNNTGRIIRELERLHIIKSKRKPWPDGHKAAQYWVNFPFDLKQAPGSTDFDDALWRTIGYSGIKQRFSQHQAQRVARRFGKSKQVVSPARCLSNDYARKSLT
jgi:hypothetical protein